MARFIANVTQGGADTSASVSIDTGLTVDGKIGIEIYGIEVLWVNGESAAAGDIEVTGGLTTTTSAPSFISADEICRVEWGLQNTGGVAVAVPFEPLKQLILIEPRVTVQPLLYFWAVSANTGQANNLQARVYYNTVKLTDLEVMRLLVGGS